MRTVGDKVIVKLDKREEVTDGGIIIPDYLTGVHHQITVRLMVRWWLLGQGLLRTP